MFFFGLLHVEAALLYALLIICAFENQRWFKSGVYSGSIERELVENIGVVAMVCQYGFCVLYGWDVSVWSAPLLFALGIISAQIYVLLIGLISPGDHKVLWILGSVSILPIVFLIGSKLTWLGFFPENGFAAY